MTAMLLLAGWREYSALSAISSRPSMGGNRRDPPRLPRADMGGCRLKEDFESGSIGDSSRTPWRWSGGVIDNCLRGGLADCVWKDPGIRCGRSLGTSISRG